MSDPGVVMPSHAAWEAACTAGEELVTHALREGLIAECVRDPEGDGAICFAMMCGGLVAIGNVLRATCLAGGEAVLEQNAVALLRGALRGAGGPVRDDGSPFTGATDA